ncbi:MAG: putative baseplate assembly protein [ANME-2 cluster archaeon]|nr:putative baseplate assembly protein [ANME-2 cluster archaeon]
MDREITLDGRTSGEIFEQARKMAPHYLPNWDSSNGNDSAVILLKIFSKLLEDIVKRMDEVPEKNFIAFLDMLGMGLYPSQPSRVPLTFTVSQGATAAVHINEQTQVAAEATQTRPEMAFEVESGKGFLATPAIVKKIISVDPGIDGIFKHGKSLELGRPIELFTGEKNLQEHVLYIAHGDLFTITGQAKIELFIQSPVPDMTTVEWEYYGEKIETRDGKEITTEGWHRLDSNNAGTVKSPLSTIPGTTPVIDIRGINSVFAKRLDQHGISTVDQLLNITPADLATKLSTNVSRAENIREAAEKGLLDRSARNSGNEFPANTITFHIVLFKNTQGEIKEFEVNGIKSKWIRCSTENIDETLSKSLVDSIMINVGPDVEGGIIPDMVFLNEVPLDIKGISDTNPIYPFGAVPIIYSTFYLASSDAFSKKWSEISISFDVMNNNNGSNKGPSPRLSWEYWNGRGWIHIPGINGLQNNFTTQGVQTVTFICPGDMQKTEVNGQENFWMRIRIVDGDYGKITFVENTDGIPGKGSKETVNEITDGTTNGIKRGLWEISYEDIKAPKFGNILVSYKEQGKKQGRTPGRIIKYNNLDYHEVSETDGKLNPFTFFDKSNDKTQSLYLGFDRQLKNGPINIFFSVNEREYPETFHPKFMWEYCNDTNSNSWTKLDVTDETENLTKRGILSVVAPGTMSSSKNFGEELYWIRGRVVKDEFTVRYQQDTASNPDLRFSPYQSHSSLEPCEEMMTFERPVLHIEKFPPLLSSININTTWACQAKTVKGEILGSSDGTPGQQFIVTKHPVFREEIWVNELSSLSVGERNDLIEGELPVHEVKDEKGNTTEFWVRWSRVDDFLSSGMEDRHYVLEAAMGIVFFGDGINGRLPPIDIDNIKADYQTGGGSAGNVEAGAISALKSSISFIDGVTNPELSDGGVDIETMEQLVVRAPRQFKNRGRAVTREDFEWIARQASRKVSRAKCIPNMNNVYAFNPGWVTLIIVPQGNEDRPELSVGLKEVVRTYMEKMCAGALKTLDRLTVNGPVYLDVSITAKLAAGSADVIPAVEAMVYHDIRKFLHPLTGGYSGGGWGFGKLPCLSDFYRLLEEMDGVDHVENLSMEIGGTHEDRKIVINPQSDFYPRLKPYNLVCSGDHHIEITL